MFNVSLIKNVTTNNKNITENINVRGIILAHLRKGQVQSKEKVNLWFGVCYYDEDQNQIQGFMGEGYYSDKVSFMRYDIQHDLHKCKLQCSIRLFVQYFLV